MECQEFLERVSAAVDRCLSKDEMGKVLDHVGRCPACRYEYEMEQITKAVIQARSGQVRTPASVVARVTEHLQQEGGKRGTVPRWRSQPWPSVLKPALAFAAAFAAVALVLNFPSEDPPLHGTSLDDVIQQSLANYSAVVRGTIVPELASNQPEHLRNYFTGKTEFEVQFPPMKDCTLLGGALNDYAGMKLAHIMYRQTKGIIYIYQTCWDEVIKGEKLKLSAAAQQQLEATGWFSESQPDGHSVVLWKKDRTLCSAVARMTPQELIACLTAGSSGGHPSW